MVSRVAFVPAFFSVTVAPNTTRSFALFTLQEVEFEPFEVRIRHLVNIHTQQPLLLPFLAGAL